MNELCSISGLHVDLSRAVKRIHQNRMMRILRELRTLLWSRIPLNISKGRKGVSKCVLASDQSSTRTLSENATLVCSENLEKKGPVTRVASVICSEKYGQSWLSVKFENQYDDTRNALIESPRSINTSKIRIFCPEHSIADHRFGLT